MLIYSIFDKTAKQFGLPFFQINDETAIRMFSNLVNDKDSMLNKNPDDYTLFRLGEFDADSGIVDGIRNPADIETCGPPTVLKNALDVFTQPTDPAA